jgi:hypothetical protein
MNLAPKKARRSWGAHLRMGGALAAALAASGAIGAQEQAPALQSTPAPTASTSSAGPIAIVPVDSGATVTGALQVSSGKTVIAASGSVTSGDKTTEVMLPRRGVLRVCASTTVKLAADTSVPEGETPGLMLALDHGAIEASFATAKNSDILLTPDFRILIGGPGAAEVKVRLGQHGDTCVDNPGADAPYVLVTSVFDGGAYRVQPGQRVMFQHGSLEAVVDQEKEPCGCPQEPRPGSNDFPAAQSAGLAPLLPVTPAPVPAPATTQTQAKEPPSEPLVYQAPTTQPAGDAPASDPAVAQPSPVPAPAAKENKPGFFHRVGRFFKRLFGAE